MRGASRATTLFAALAVARGLVPDASARRAMRRPVRGVGAVEDAVNPRAVGLALELDDGTRKVNSVAENTQFVTGFFRGLGSAEAFAALSTSFFYVYEAMERAMDETESETLRALDFPELRRLPGLERDMEFYYGADWRTKKPLPSPATKEYVARIREVAASDEPELLVGHLYSRYLGDLFGGQMMSGMALKSLGDTVGDAAGGLAFYAFDAIPDTRSFITEWYSTLNSLDLAGAQRERIVEEANVVFRLNIDIFNELEGNPLRSFLAVALQSLKEKFLGR